ncbi:MAG: electron transfer flavoprotein subunit alpha [Clostridia bacterium]|nr:electron transfer flavoprotein subunit alpha [Clostridia bacterium]
MYNLYINKDKCTGCKLCTYTCPYDAIRIKEEKASILTGCTQCGACITSCRFDAIDYYNHGNEKPADISEYVGVWVFGEIRYGTVSNVVLELLGEGRKIANELEVRLSVVLMGYGIEETARGLIAYGADEVYMIDSPQLRLFNDEAYTDIFVQLVQRYKPEIVLIGATTYGRSIAPRIASRLDTGLTADCTSLEVDREKRVLLQTRPAFGGNIMATIICPNHRPQMSTVRPKVMKAPKPDFKRVGEIIKPDVLIPKKLKVEIEDIVNLSNQMVNLADADIIVSAGRGIGDRKNLRLVEELAEVLGAAVGATRTIVDAGWIEYSHQIGQTGKTVGPKAYFAFGISGAIQHLAGMSTSDVIIAVNNDPEAPIFKIADFGIVGDAVEILQALIKELKIRVS